MNTFIIDFIILQWLGDKPRHYASSHAGFPDTPPPHLYTYSTLKQEIKSLEQRAAYIYTLTVV